MIPNKLSSIELWDATRSGSITLPETFRSVIVTQPAIHRELGKPDTLQFSIRSNSKLATAYSSQDYYLSKKKIIRLVYDDSTFEEWRITGAEREFSGGKNFQIDCEPLWMDLAYRTIRQALSTGAVRNQVNFYGSTVSEILTAILTATYNAPPLYQAGTIDSGIAEKMPRLSFNGSSFLQVLYTIADQTDSEFDVTWNSSSSKYDINFYALGDMGGGTSEAGSRIIAMGGGDGNRQVLNRKNSTEDFFSRLIPIAGADGETTGIAGTTFSTDYVAYAGGQTILDLLPGAGDLITDVTYSDDLYFGNDTDGFFPVVAIGTTQITLTGDASSMTSGRFTITDSHIDLSYVESPAAVSDIGIVEKTYRRTDIGAYTNIIKQQGISDDFSTFSSGVPVGTAVVGSPTISEETGDEFVKFGAKSCKIVAGAGEGLSWSVDIDNTYPYFSLLTYLYVSSGSVKMEFEDSAGNLVPAGQYAETNEAITQGLSMEGAKPVSGTATIRVLAKEAGTVFYLDACVLTNTATKQNYQPLMGPFDLWSEAARQLNLYGGLQPDSYSGSCWDDAYFNASLSEMKLGSWVTVKDDWDGSVYHTNFVGRIIGIGYTDEFDHGRVEKTVTISNRSAGLDKFLNGNYLTKSGAQADNGAKTIFSVDAFVKAIQDGNLKVTKNGSIVLVGDGEITNDTSDFTLNKYGIVTVDNSVSPTQKIQIGSGAISIDEVVSATTYTTYIQGGSIIFSDHGSGLAVVGVNSSKFAGNLGFFGHDTHSQQTVTGSRGGNAALQSLLSALDAHGLIVDSST